MQPLQQLPASALRALRGVLTDIDDTLTHDGAIEPAALAALQGLQRGTTAGDRHHRPAGRLERALRHDLAGGGHRRRERCRHAAP